MFKNLREGIDEEFRAAQSIVTDTRLLDEDTWSFGGLTRGPVKGRDTTAEGRRYYAKLKQDPERYARRLAWKRAYGKKRRLEGKAA